MVAKFNQSDYFISVKTVYIVDFSILCSVTKPGVFMQYMFSTKYSFFIDKSSYFGFSETLAAIFWLYLYVSVTKATARAVRGN